MQRVVIGNSEFERVTIELVGPATDWTIAHITVTCGAWNGNFRCEFYSGELRQFGEQVEKLYQTLNGTAKLAPVEPNLSLELVGDGKGHIALTGKAAAEFYTGTHLTFHFSLDQTELPSIAASLFSA